jgi:acyl-CoA oxidase
MGFLAANKIGPMKTDMDVDVTFEGDNTVMMQQVGCATRHLMGSKFEGC